MHPAGTPTILEVLVASASDAQAVAVYCVLIGFLHVSLSSFLTGPEFDQRSKRIQVAQSAVNLGLTGTLALLYASVLITESTSYSLLGDEGAASRVFGKFTDEAVLAMHLNFAMVLYECFLYALLGKSLDLWAHHVLGIILLTLTLRSGQCGIYLAWAGISEGTSVNLSLRNLLLESGMKKSRIYVVNGLLLWLSFLVLRVLNLAVLSWRIMRDVFVVLPAARLEAEADPVLRYMDLFASVFIWALSTWWFYKITLGVIDGLRGGKKLKLEDDK